MSSSWSTSHPARRHRARCSWRRRRWPTSRGRRCGSRPTRRAAATTATCSARSAAGAPGAQTGAGLARRAADGPDITALERGSNSGHQAALTAGLDRARGDAVITLDGDGQHPPELIVDMVALYEAGYEVVLTQRVSADQPRFKRWTSTIFYRLLSAIADTPINAGSADYRLVARPVLEALREMREYHRFLRGMVAWAGYKTVALPYAERERLGGGAKDSLGRVGRLAADPRFSLFLGPLGGARAIRPSLPPLS